MAAHEWNSGLVRAWSPVGMSHRPLNLRDFFYLMLFDSKRRWYTGLLGRKRSNCMQGRRVTKSVI